MYHSINVTLSDSQLKKLASGDSIRLKHSALTGSNTIHVTTTQLKKIEKAKLSGKGVQLSFSGQQMKHNAKSGGSLFDYLSKFAPILIDKAGDFAKDKANDLVDVLSDKATDMIKDKSADLVDKLKDKATDMVKKKKKQKKKQQQQGDGLFDFIPGGVGDFLNGVGNTAASLALPLAQNVISSKMGFGVKKPRKPRIKKQQGDGLFDFIPNGVGDFVNDFGKAYIDKAKRVRELEKIKGLGLRAPGY